jgi:hypothetical protein
VRIDERSVLELPCPASGTDPGERHCPEVSRAEVAASLDGPWLHRYDAFVAVQRAERDPETRWCAQPGCGAVCLPCVEDSLVSAGAAVACLAGSATLASLPLLYPALSEAIGLTPRLGIATAVLGALGFGGALWHGSGRVGPRPRECPSCGHSVCHDCKAPWHPGTLCEELPAAQLVRWCEGRDAGQCPRCSVFIERRAGCNHMVCRCGHSFCWLCLGPQSERCSCPVIGGQRTAEARLRLAFVGQRAITFGPLRRLFGALLAGAVLQLADVLCAGVCSALTALLEGPRATQLAVAQLVLSLAHLALARASLRAVPPRLAFYLAGLLPYTMSRRCWAALPAVANAAYALESLLPVVCAPLAAGLVSLVTWLVVLAPFGAVSSLLVRFAAACVAPAGAALPTRLLATLPTALAYAWGALGTVGALGLSCFLTFKLSIYCVVFIAGSATQAGVQRRMHDAIRLLMDGRQLLLLASLFLAFDRFSVGLWADLEAVFAPTGLFSPGLDWSPFTSYPAMVCSAAALAAFAAKFAIAAIALVLAAIAASTAHDAAFAAVQNFENSVLATFTAALATFFAASAIATFTAALGEIKDNQCQSTAITALPFITALPSVINPFYALLHGLHLPAAMVCSLFLPNCMRHASQPAC